MSKVYGYCRISRKEQNIDRQERNIKAAYPDAIIVKEAFTGTKIEGRKELEKILKAVKEGDTIVFDSVSRMSRNAAEGTELYEQLYKSGINLVFLKEPHINTATYQKAISTAIPMTGTAVDAILKGINEYMMILAKEQITIAFDQAQKEVDDLRQRTKEGIQTARLNGKQIGQMPGRKLIVKKAESSKEAIKKYSIDFNGTLPDVDIMKILGIARNTYYKYKRELKELMD